MAAQRPGIVVVGSINVDMIVRSERLPQPGETVVGGVFFTAGGGKGANQAIAAHRLGADVRLVARIGRDALADVVLSSFQADGLPTRWLTVDPEAATGVALILVDREGQNLISVAPGANARLSPADVRAAEPAFHGASVLLVQLEVPLETVAAALEMARQRQITTILNPAPAAPVRDALLQLVDWLTPNESEARALTGISVDDDAAAERAARRLLARGVRQVVITRGHRGALVATDRVVHRLPAFSVPTIDTTAAGDAFNGALAVGLARGMSPRETLQFASAAAALSTTRAGAQPSLPTAEAVESFLSAPWSERSGG